jgi:Family of unknown function (DUF6527)
MKIRVLHHPGRQVIGFRCPGCGHEHAVDLNRWLTWNESQTAPTITGPLGYEQGNAKTCHSQITAGKIEFFADSTHALSGKTVELPDLILDTPATQYTRNLK